MASNETNEEPLKPCDCSEIVAPKPKSRDLEYKPFLERVQYVLATFKDNEFNAATTVVTSPDIEGDSKGVTTYEEGIFLGMVGEHPVGLLTCGQGRDCEETMKRGICLFPNAEYLVAAGMCYGFSDGECRLGDVLISNMIIDLGNYRIGEKVESRGDRTTMKDQIKKIFCFNPKLAKKFEVAKGRNAKYLVGKIVSAPNLVNDADTKKKFRDAFKEEKKVYGGEMEGGEMLRLQKDGIEMPNGEKKFVQVIVIKSVTDFGEGKTDEWQFIGSQAAFNYVKDQMAIQAESSSDVKFKMTKTRGDRLQQEAMKYPVRQNPKIVPDAGAPPGSQEKIDINVVAEALHKVRTLWEFIGLGLRVDPNELNDISDRWPDNKKRLLEMLKLWKILGNNITWKAIVDVLKSNNVQRPDVAKEIEEKYC